MKEKEIITREIGLTFDFLRYLLENPNEIEKIPNNTEIVFLEDNFPEIEKKNKISARRKTTAYHINKTFEAISAN